MQIGTTPKEHVAFLLANKGTHNLLLDNDAYGIYHVDVRKQDEGQWFYINPEDLFKAFLAANRIWYSKV